MLIVIIICTLLYLILNIQHNNLERTLKEAGKNHNLFIGTAVNGEVLDKDEDYANLIKNEFSLITPENEMKFSVIHPDVDKFDFSESDKIVKFALENDIKVRGHTLVWNKRIPEWLEKGNYSKEEMEHILKNHIFTVMEHYKGQIYAWDVVNEAFNNDGSLKDSIWLRTIGPEYIKKSFEWAKEADPNALLFYNDYSAEVINDKSNAIYKMIEQFKKEGTPIDGIGFQFHTSLHQKFTQKELIKNMKRFSEIGVKVNITELDVKLSDTVASSKVKYEKQANQYSVVLKSCLKIDNDCTSFGMWGLTDKYTWLKDDSPLIFNEEFEKKPSYDALISILTKK